MRLRKLRAAIQSSLIAASGPEAGGQAKVFKRAAHGLAQATPHSVRQFVASGF